MAALDESCRKCRLYERSGCRTPNMDPYGPKDAVLYVVGMAPGRQEDAAGVPFVGPSGDLLKEQLRRCRVDLSKVRFYNAVNCFPPSHSPTLHEKEMCAWRVREDIKKVRPNAVLCCGADAVKAVFPALPEKNSQVGKIRGNTVPFFTEEEVSIPAVVSWHPSYILRGVDESERTLWNKDLALAASLSRTCRYGSYDKDFPKETVVQCLQWEQVVECFGRLKNESVVSFDIETSALQPFNKAEKVVSIAFGFSDGHSYAVPLSRGYWSQVRQTSLEDGVRSWLTKSPDTPQIRVGHNLKFDLLWLLYKYLEQPQEWTPPKNVYFEDTLLMAWMVDGRPFTHGLKFMVWKHFGVDSWAVDVKNIMAMEWEEVLHYNALDSYYTLRLWSRLTSLLASDKEKVSLMDKLLVPCTLAFLRHEADGVCTDAEFLTKYSKTLEEEILALKRDTPVDMTSTKQLKEYFEERNFPLEKTEKGNVSLSSPNVQKIIDGYGDKVAKNLVRYRGLAKLQSTYAKGMLKQIYEDGKMHPSYNLASTITGRTSSQGPNMQNWPKRKDSTVRGVVVPPPGHVIASFDYGQIEARIFGVITADPVFCDALLNDYDIHLENANFLFGEEEGHLYRNPVKNATFALLYGAGDAKVAATAGVDISKVVSLKRQIFSKWKKFGVWQKETKKFLDENGYVRSLFGRDRHAPMSYSEMLNHCCQSSASDITLTALVALRKYRLMAMIHDDLSFYLPEQGLEEAVEEIMKAMLSVPWVFIKDSPLKKRWVPLQVECSLAPLRWSECQEVAKLGSLEMGLDSEQKCIEQGLQFLEEASQ